MEYPVCLICERCREIFGCVLNPSKCIAKNAWDIKGICTRCIEQLKEEKGINPKSPEDWARLLEEVL